uniref:Uncharacterized protein n=1 Tax=Hemiselmis andersenii TaxID=464988 RepID=A0A6T8NP37_HEMAN|mmetsp:Transcript_13486/g.31261  ORF Transcript_13486/g.31261 Transcript_13486/m.31261 type:complete len:104 (-) Transcript_13486:121-432(-)|eukprot:CAMPEP_0114152186 /NCGR_PEP_ID=MMETSP0043_2-20121206/23663_1 /TAXON_ID=464988 /ORGANISM="Hemiselmis andersenii, Strain CCMP644" /LENGTH=103 /DNA_ID=CAMNT_0001247089 /DNA_START=84 /DNA_END=395 /DNA_ORIENTATION=+
MAHASGHLPITQQANMMLQESITKDHSKTGRAKLFEELRSWPTTPSNPKMAFEGYAAPREGSLVRTGGKITSNEPHGHKKYFHQADELLIHYDYALKTGMKAR